MKKECRGSYDYRVDNDHEVFVLRWFDNKHVTLASSFVDVGKASKVKRLEKKLREIIEVTRPDIVAIYNMKIGKVDKMDSCLPSLEYLFDLGNGL